MLFVLLIVLHQGMLVLVLPTVFRVPLRCSTLCDGDIPSCTIVAAGLYN